MAEDQTQTIASSALDDTEDDARGDGADWESSEEDAEESTRTGGQQEQEQEAQAGDGESSVAAAVEGMLMRVKAPKRPSSHRGVYWNCGRWLAQISTNGHRQHLGLFDDKEAAARAYDEEVKQVHNNPTLNFLPDGSLTTPTANSSTQK